MIATQFNSKKTTQVVCRLLHKSDGKMNYMKLIKELYIIDRVCLDKWNRSVTGDIYFSMGKGPVLSNVLNKIHSQAIEDEYWDKYVKRSGIYDISLKTDKIRSEELSAREKKVIDEIFAQFEDFNQWQIVDWCHDNLSEWKDPKGGRAQIFIKDILKALGKTKEEIKEIEEEIKSIEFAKKAFDDE